MNIHITYDIEVWCFGWDRLDEKFPSAFRRYIYGPPPREEGALPLNLKILRNHGLKAIFFVEPLFSLRFGSGPLQEIVELLLSHGQEVQLHLHPEWLDELPQQILSPRQKTPNMHAFSREEQRTLLATGTELLKAAGAPTPTAFRAGNFSMNADTLAALTEQGFVVDSSLNALCKYPHPNLNPLECSRVGGLIEYPVSLFKDGFGRIRPMQITACSANEFEQALSGMRDQGQFAATLVSHNFELLTPGLARNDRIATKRFERLCAWLSRHQDEFPVGSFDQEFTEEAKSSGCGDWATTSVVATATRHGEQLLRHFVVC